MEWEDFINEEMKEDYFNNLSKFLSTEKNKYSIYPEKENIFNAFKYCSFNDTKVVIVGMDPYHGPNQAHGLAFSVNNGINIPPSLKNIFKELYDDLGCKPPQNGNLIPWAKQGVLLLNSILTVRRGEPASHKDSGWQIFTDKAIKLLNDNKDNLVFILWGTYARSKKALISNKSHLILESGHPSFFSYHLFKNNKHFSKCNQFLKTKNITPIDWHLNDEDI